ncbi:MAG: 2-5 ligase [Nevskia sp.]|nr:2-5 ligase [Nevskia sp.]
MPKAAEQLALFADLPPAARQRKSAVRARFFFALWPGELVRTQLNAAAATIPPGSARALRVKPERYHLTLAFLGALQPQQVEAAQKAGSAVAAAAFRLQLDTVGYFSGPRLAWIGPQAAPSELLRLKAELDRELLHLGLPVERNQFQPHVSCLRGLDDAPDAPSVSISWPIDEFVLMRSAIKDGVTIYKRIGRWRMAARSGSVPTAALPELL